MTKNSNILSNIMSNAISLWRKIRKHKPTYYTLLSIISILFILCVLPFVSYKVSNTLYNQQKYEDASKLSIIQYVALYNKYKIQFNAGNAKYMDNNYKDAIMLYEKALDNTPAKDKCKIKWNLSTAYIKLGEPKEISEPTEAIKHYSRALNQLSDSTCLNNQTYKKQWTERIEDLTERIEKINERMKNKKTESNRNDNTSPEKLNETEKREIMDKILTDNNHSGQRLDMDELSGEEAYNMGSFW